MKICVVSDEHFPHRGADTEVIVNTAAALGEAGAEVTLLTPWLWHKQTDPDALYDYYGVAPSFRHRPLFNPFPPERVLRSQQFVHGALASLSRPFREADVVHSRDLAPLVTAHALGRPWSYETYRKHLAEKPWIGPLTHRLDLDRAVGAIAHSEQSRADLIALGFPRDAVLVARPGFNRSAFDGVPAKDEARERLGLDSTRAIVGYIGNIGRSKGVETCLAAMQPIEDADLLVVGGSPREVEEVECGLPAGQRSRVIFSGHRPAVDVPLYLAACDALLVPPLDFNSRGPLLDRLLPTVLPGTPLKIYPYWAARRAVIAADQPHNTEILRHERTALLYDPVSIPSFTQAIRRALDEPEMAEQIATRAAAEVAELTYAARAEKMLAFFERRLAERNGRAAPFSK
jgi:glycosyltransferase involved in cell wall biosynthesis